MSNHPFNISEYSVWGDNLPKMGEDATSILKREFSQPSKFDHPLTTSVLSNSRGEEDRNMDFSDYEIPKATSMDDQDVVEAPFLPESPLFRKFQSELNTPRRKVGRRTSKRGGSKHSNILPSFLDVEFGDHGNGSEKGEGGGSEDERFVKSSGGKMRRSSLSGDVVLQYDPWSPNPTHHDHGIKNTAKSTSAALHSVSNFTFDDDQFEEQNGQENNQVAEDEDLNQRLKREMKIITESSYQVGSPILKSPKSPKLGNKHVSIQIEENTSTTTLPLPPPSLQTTSSLSISPRETSPRGELFGNNNENERRQWIVGQNKSSREGRSPRRSSPRANKEESNKQLTNATVAVVEEEEDENDDDEIIDIDDDSERVSSNQTSKRKRNKSIFHRIEKEEDEGVVVEEISPSSDKGEGSSTKTIVKSGRRDWMKRSYSHDDYSLASRNTKSQRKGSDSSNISQPTQTTTSTIIPPSMMSRREEIINYDEIENMDFGDEPSLVKIFTEILKSVKKCELKMERMEYQMDVLTTKLDLNVTKEERWMNDLEEKLVPMAGVVGGNMLVGDEYEGNRSLSFVQQQPIAYFATVWCEVGGKRYRYEGMVEEGVPCGLGAAFDVDGGKRYEGEWEEGLPHGEGISFDGGGGRFYEGEWAGGVQNGQGIWFDEDENIRYEGEWKDRKFDGSGTLYWPNTADEQIKYKGEWKEDKKHGYGIEYSSTGNVVYEGEWDYGERHGKGILFSLEEGDGSKEYEGDWEDGLKHGYGILYEEGKKKYEGEFDEDVFHGNGKSFYDNGNINYEGSWNNGSAHGKGVSFHYETGMKFFEGDWREGVPHGQGISYHKYVSIPEFSGRWEKGFYVG